MSAYPVYRPRGGVNRLLGWSDDFTSWFLYGHETWLVAVLKAVPLFLFIYFVITYIPNYVYYLLTVEIPFLRLSDDVGFLIANGIAGGNFALLVVGLGVVVGGLGAAAVVYLYFESRRITRREAGEAARLSRTPAVR